MAKMTIFFEDNPDGTVDIGYDVEYQNPSEKDRATLAMLSALGTYRWVKSGEMTARLPFLCSDVMSVKHRSGFAKDGETVVANEAPVVDPPLANQNGETNG